MASVARVRARARAKARAWAMASVARVRVRVRARARTERARAARVAREARAAMEIGWARARAARARASRAVRASRAERAARVRGPGQERMRDEGTTKDRVADSNREGGKGRMGNHRSPRGHDRKGRAGVVLSLRQGGGAGDCCCQHDGHIAW
jgi:hypothetical protein